MGRGGRSSCFRPKSRSQVWLLRYRLSRSNQNHYQTNHCLIIELNLLFPRGNRRWKSQFGCTCDRERERESRAEQRDLEQKYFKMLIRLQHTKTYSSGIHNGTTPMYQVCDTILPPHLSISPTIALDILYLYSLEMLYRSSNTVAIIINLCFSVDFDVRLIIYD